MSVEQSLAIGIAKIAVAGCGPSVIDNAAVMSSVAVTKDLRPAATRREVAEARVHIDALRGMLAESAAAVAAEEAKAKAKASASSRSGSSRRSRSSGGGQSSSSSAPLVDYRRAFVGLVLAAAAQGALTVSAFAGAARTVEVLTQTAAETIGAALPPLLARSSSVGSSPAAAVPLPNSAEVGMRLAGALLQLLVSLRGVVYLEGSALQPGQKAIERDLRRRLMLKHFKEQYFSRTLMLQALGFARADVYESLQNSVTAWATDAAGAAALAAKLGGHLAVTMAAASRAVGLLPIAQFAALFLSNAALPLLAARFAPPPPAKALSASASSSASSSAATKGCSSSSTSRAEKGASSSRRSSTASASGSAADHHGAERRGARLFSSASSSVNGGKDKTGDSAAIAAPPRTLRQRLYAAIAKVLSYACAANGVAIAGAGALAAAGWLTVLAPTDSAAAWGSEPTRRAVRLLFAGRMAAAVPTAGASAAVRTAAVARHWAMASLLLANACLTLSSVLRTVYGPARAAGRSAGDIVRKVELLTDLRRRCGADGEGSGKGAAASSLASSSSPHYARDGDSIVVSGLRLAGLGKPSASSSGASNGSSSSSSTSGRSKSSSKREALSQPAALTMTIAPGSDVLVCSKDRLAATALVEMIGGFAPCEAPLFSVGTSATVPSTKDGAAVTIRAPPADAMLLLGRHSFMPRLTLKQQLLYPKLSASHQCTMGESGLVELLDRVGMGALFDQHEEALAAKGWDTPCEQLSRRLSPAERQRLCLARALYHRPRFLFIDDGLAALAPAEERSFYELCREFCITTITVAPLEPSAIARYCGLHKALLQLDSEGGYLFGSLMPKPNNACAGSSDATSSAADASPHRSLRRSMSTRGSEEDGLALPPVRVVSSSTAAAVGKVVSFDPCAGQYAL